MRAKLAASIAIALLIGAACGDPEASSAEVDRLKTAAQRTEAAGSSNIAFTMSMSMGERSIDFDGDGAFDYESGVGQMNMGSPMLPEEISMIIDGSTAYYSSGEMFGVQTSKPWVSVELADMPGVSAQSLMQPGPSNPTQFLEYLEGVTDDIRVVGENEEVRGVSTTHFEAMTDMTAAMQDQAAGDPEAEAEVQEVLDQLGSMEPVPIEAWIDDEGLLRKVRMEVTTDAEGVGEVSMTMEFEFFDFGTDVSVEVPKPGQVEQMDGFPGAP